MTMKLLLKINLLKAKMRILNHHIIYKIKLNPEKKATLKNQVQELLGAKLINIQQKRSKQSHNQDKMF